MHDVTYLSHRVRLNPGISIHNIFCRLIKNLERKILCLRNSTQIDSMSKKLMSLLGSKYNIFHNFDHISNAYMQMEPEKHAILIEN